MSKRFILDLKAFEILEGSKQEFGENICIQIGGWYLYNVGEYAGIFLTKNEGVGWVLTPLSPCFGAYVCACLLV